MLCIFFQTTVNCAVWTDTDMDVSTMTTRSIPPRIPPELPSCFQHDEQLTAVLSVLSVLSACLSVCVEVCGLLQPHLSEHPLESAFVVRNSDEMMCGSVDTKMITRIVIIMSWIYNNNLGSSMTHNVVTVMWDHVWYSEGP